MTNLLFADSPDDDAFDKIKEKEKNFFINTKSQSIEELTENKYKKEDPIRLIDDDDNEKIYI